MYGYWETIYTIVVLMIGMAIIFLQVEDHVWYAHLGGVFPYKCELCHNSFMTVSMMQEHWTISHPMEGGGIKFSKNSEAGVKFLSQLRDCFPEIAADEIGQRDVKQEA